MQEPGNIKMEHSISFKVKFKLGEKVWHVLDSEHNQGMVTGYIFREGCVIYQVVWQNLEESSCYGLELTDEKQFNVNN